jgi:hypothetical protein
MKHETLDPVYMSIRAYSKQIAGDQGVDPELISPLQLADIIEDECQRSLSALQSLRSTENTPTLTSELDDIESWVYLGFYFADKLRAAVMLETFRYSRDAAEKKKAINFLQKCTGHWENVVELTKNRYRPMPYVSIETENPQWDHFTDFHWSHFTGEVARDLQFAKDLQ